MIDFSREQWDEVKANAARWWDGTLGRPLIQARVWDRDPGRPAPRLPRVDKATAYDLSIPADDIVDRWDYELCCQTFLGDGFPYVWPDLGPGVIATFLGAVPEPRSDTVWFHPPPGEVDIHDLRFVYDPDSVWLQRVKDICRAAHERWEGQVQIGMTDLGGNLDILSTFRPSERLLLDLYDYPEEVVRLTWEAHEAWWRAFPDINAVLQPTNPGYTAWSPIFSATPCYMLQCDFCYMIGPDDFRDFAAPELAACCGRLDHGFYHLDGKGQLSHLEQLLAIPELCGVQWVPGTGSAPESEWPDVYRAIHAAGKRIQVFTPEGLEAVRTACGTAENAVLLGGGGKTREEAEAYLRGQGVVGGG